MPATKATPPFTGVANGSLPSPGPAGCAMLITGVTIVNTMILKSVLYAVKCFIFSILFIGGAI
jgi:hypothetical protein